MYAFRETPWGMGQIPSKRSGASISAWRQKTEFEIVCAFIDTLAVFKKNKPPPVKKKLHGKRVQNASPANKTSALGRK
jgi:hypothetical protein